MSLPAPTPSSAPLSDRVVWIDGALRRGPDAAISLFDRGARDGEGIFETLRVYRGHPFLWTRHLERLVVSAAELGFAVPPSPGVLRAALEDVLAAAGLADAVARLTVTRGIPSTGRGRRTRTGAWIEAEPIAARLWRGTRRGAARLVVSRRPFQPGPLGGYKTTSRLAYHLAREEARAAGADETLLVSPEGVVLEGAVSNLFVVVEGRVITPPLTLGILPGIARALVLELCGRMGIATAERPVGFADLSRCDEVFVTNSVQEVVPAGWIDGRATGPPDVAARLATAYRDEVTRACGP